MSVPCLIIYERISLAFQQQTGELRACWGWELGFIGGQAAQYYASALRSRRVLWRFGERAGRTVLP